jgi:hypothetical protein
METTAKPIGRTHRGWEITKSAWRVLKLDKELVALPLLSSILSILGIVSMVAISLVGAHYLTGATLADVFNNGTENAWSYVAVFVTYLFTAFIVNFFGAAITYGAIERFRGNDPTLRKSIAAAQHHVSSIAKFSLLTATIGFALQALEEHVPLAGKVAVWLVHASWSIASMFAIPVIVMSDKPTGPIEATRKSVDIIKKTWGETAASQIGIGLIQIMYIIGWFSLVAALTVSIVIFPVPGNYSLMGIGIASMSLFILGLVIISVIFSTLAAIAKAAVYHYATTGESPEMFNKQLLREAMTPKKARKIFG